MEPLRLFKCDETEITLDFVQQIELSKKGVFWYICPKTLDMVTKMVSKPSVRSYSTNIPKIYIYVVGHMVPIRILSKNKP